MTVIILSALQTEIDVLVESVDNARHDEIGGWPTWTGPIGSCDVVLARAGLGKVNTAALAAVLCQTHAPSLMVFTGVAGGLDPSLGVGDIVIGERTIQHDAGVIGPGGNLQRYQAGHIPFYNPTDEFGFTPSAKLLAEMQAAVQRVELTPVLDRPPTVEFGTILTGDVFLQDTGTRDRLYTELRAQAIEMEGAALSQVAARFGVDHIVVRSLSDMAEGEADAHFERFVAEVSANSARLVLGLIDGLEEDDRDLPVGS